MGTVYFQSKNAAVAYLTNFYPAPITVDGLVYPTSEHYYQAMKFAGTPHAETIRQAPDAGRAKRLGQKKGMRPDWEQVKETVMLYGLWSKFTQHPDLLAKLLATGTEDLVEVSAWDGYWGTGKDGHGLNRLGVLLAWLRDQLRGG